MIGLLVALLTVSTDSVPSPALGPIPCVSFWHVWVLKEGKGITLKQSPYRLFIQEDDEKLTPHGSNTRTSLWQSGI